MNLPSKSCIIFNIQKFSLNDGPGIRTVIFFKGCPLKCKWCANPESQNARIQTLWDKEKCLGCLQCLNNCPAKAISFLNNAIHINDELCTGCQLCSSLCPENALKPEGEKKEISEILKICLQDRAFYEESGGGVTISGGEALMHPDFALAALKALKNHNIHTALETTGYASINVFQKIINYVDLLLFDMKHWDEKKHIEGTDVSNKIILKNMKLAIDSGKDVLPRLPVIPGFNNTLEDAYGFVRRLQETGASKVQILPFHQFGEKKYDMLGKKYAFSNVPILHEEDLQNFIKIFIDHNINAFF